MKKILYLLTILTVFSSCGNDFEYAFDKTVTERIEESKSNLTSTLSAAEFGWKAVLIGTAVDNYSSGSFIAFKFNQNEDQNNGTVLMNSGFEEATSEFAITHQEGAILQFNTPNDVLYWMVEPRANYAAQGLGGEMEYIFMKEEDEKLFFRGKENEGELVLEKATAKDWENLSVIQNNFENFITNNKENSRYQVISVTGGIKDASEDEPFFVRFRSAGWDLKGKEKFTYRATYNVDGEDLGQNDAMFVFTLEGMQLSNPITVEGNTVSHFVYNEEQGKWLVANEGVTGEFVFSDVPVYPQPGVVDLLFEKSMSKSDRSGTKGMLLRGGYSTEGPIKDLADRILGSDQEEPEFKKLLAVIGYVTPDGEELGDGLIYTSSDGSEFAYIPVDYVKTAEHQFKIVRTGEDIITSANWAAAADKINNDADINDYLDIICSENGWSVAVDYFGFGIYNMYTFELGNNDDSANWFSDFTVTIG